MCPYKGHSVQRDRWHCGFKEAENVTVQNSELELVQQVRCCIIEVLLGDRFLEVLDNGDEPAASSVDTHSIPVHPAFLGTSPIPVSFKALEENLHLNRKPKRDTTNCHKKITAAKKKMTKHSELPG